jgi:hypothetical protein
MYDTNIFEQVNCGRLSLLEVRNQYINGYG